MTRVQTALPASKPKEAHPPALPALWKEAALVILSCVLTVAGLVWIFPPNGVWPLALVSLIPWAIMLCAARRAWLAHWSSLLAGLAFFLIGLRWLYVVTDLGYVALAIYLAIYWPLAGWAIRTGRRHGISPIWSLPVAWVACEYLRAWVMSGFPWLFLAHSMYDQLALIQISDLAGAYLLTFLLAMVNGVAAEGVLRAMGRGSTTSRRQFVAGSISTVALFVGALGYGFFQLHRDTLKPGPRVAVVQEDFPETYDPRAPMPDPRLIFARYVMQAASAAADHPDLIVFPEAAWAGVQDAQFVALDASKIDGRDWMSWNMGRIYNNATAALARGDALQLNDQLMLLERAFRPAVVLPRIADTNLQPTALIVGSLALEYTPQDVIAKKKQYNSSLFYGPNGVQLTQRYDKRHLVPFGELVPFRGGRLHWLYRWLNSLSPFSRNGEIEYSLTPGAAYNVFELRAGDLKYTFGTPICYEDVMPCVVRDFVWSGGRKRTDFLVSMSNDGWFRPPDSLMQHPMPGFSGWLEHQLLCANELPQHLAICVFRAVENRVGIARAVNTGYSGFIDSNGRIYSLVEENGHTLGVPGFRVDQVWLDDRRSLYGAMGDWFAGLCLILTCLLWANAVAARWIASARAHVAALRARWRTRT